ncbi:MAG: cadherin-like beta sandwich domain-containing protein [Gammaproteobacteria bacterium]|nr:cadherin-like beta sandwich domain-containing protein [Gammaproteobacteria bacterium]
MKMRMQKKVFAGLFLAAAFFAAAGEARAQHAPPTALTYEPVPGSESSRVNLRWTNTLDGGLTARFHTIAMRVRGDNWPGVTVTNELPDGVEWDGVELFANTVDGPVTSGDLIGLAPATTYELRMRSYDQIQSVPGGWSATLQVETATQDTPSPALSPRKLTANPGGKKWSIELQWSVPSGFTAANYHVRWRTAKIDPDRDNPGLNPGALAGAWQNASGDDADCAAGAAAPEDCGEELGAEARRYMLSDLPANKEYDFEVRASTATGAGGWSNRLTLTMNLLGDDASLDSLQFLDNAARELTPEFDSATLSYTVEVRSHITAVDITAAPSDDNATIKVGRAGALGNSSTQTLNKSAGAARQGPARNTFQVEVTAEDGSTKKTYEIAVTRQAAKSDASLANLEVVRPGITFELTPAFSADTLAYSVSVRSSRSNLEFIPAPADSAASVKVGRAGETLMNLKSTGFSPLLAINKDSGTEPQTGGNLFLVETTAEDGNTTRTYTISASRRKASNSTLLTRLLLGGGTLSPAFAPGITSYAGFLPNSVQSVNLTVTPAHPGTAASVFVDGELSGSSIFTGGCHRYYCRNQVEVVVTAEDGVNTRTYKVNLFRGGPITNLQIHDAAETSRTGANSLLTGFNQARPLYSLNVDKAVTAVILTVNHGAEAHYLAPGAPFPRRATISLVRTLPSLASGAASDPIPLLGGENELAVFIDLDADYIVTITRPLYTPGNLSADGKREKLRVSWDAGGGESGYRVRWRLKDAGGGSPGAWQSASGDDEDGEAVAVPRYTIAGLTDGAAYEVQARGLSEVHGNTDWSETVEGTPAVGLDLSPPDDLAFVAGEALAAGEGVTLPEAADGSTPYTYALTGLPAGLAFDANTREITGTPSAAAAAADVVYEVTDNNSDTDSRAFRVEILNSHLNVAADGADGINAADGILIARYLLGARGESFAAGQSGLDAARLEAAVQAGIRGMKLDVDGDNTVDGDDGILIARYVLGLRGAELIAGFSGLTASDVETKISDLLP